MIKQNIFLQKLHKFNKYNNVLELYLKDEYEKKQLSNPTTGVHSRNEASAMVGSSQEKSLASAAPSTTTSKSNLLSAIEATEDGKVVDLSLLAKTSLTISTDINRFKCVLGNTALKQKNPQRMYMKALPEHVKEDELKKQAFEGKIIRKIPKRKTDTALDPKKV